MYQLRFLKFVTVAICLWVCQGSLVGAEQVGAVDRAKDSCSILRLTGGEFTPNSSIPLTRLTGVFSVVVKCGSARNLRISLSQMNIHNAGTKIQVVGGTGIFASANAATTADSITIPISSTQSSGGDSVKVRVDLVAPSGKMLAAGNDYRVVVKANLDP
jgi:hypothetical protein